MDCTYSYKDQDSVNVLDLAKVFYKATKVLDPDAAIYSVETVQDAAVTILRKQVGRQTEIQANQNLEEALSFITNAKNAPIIRSIGEDIDRLAPEYIEENRINKFIEQELEKNLSIDATTAPEVDKERLKKVIANFPSIDPGILAYHLSKIEEILEVEEKTKDFGSAIHKLISLAYRSPDGINGSQYTNVMNEFIKNNPDIFGEGQDDIWRGKINEVVQNVLQFAMNIGVPVTELLLSSSLNDKAQIKGRLDLIAVDKAGVAHIFEIKISRHPYTEWDPVKLLTLDWQLALYRQLLSKHLVVNDTRLYVIPIQFGELKNPSSFFYTSPDNRKGNSKSGLIEGGRLTSIARLLIPNEVFSEYNEEKETEFIKDLEGLLPSYKIKSSRDDYNVDEIVERAKERGVYSLYNKFNKTPEYPDEEFITADTEEEFRTKIEKYVQYALLQKNINVVRLRDALSDRIKDPTKTSLAFGSSKQSVIADKVFKDYFSGNWEVITNIPEATNLGLIVLRNNFSNTIDVVSVSIYSSLRDFSGLPGTLYGDIEYIKAFLFLNNFKEELLIGKGYKIGSISTFHPEGGEVTRATYFKETAAAFDLFKERMAATGRTSKIALDPNIHLHPKEIAALQTINASLRSYEGERKKDLERVFQDIMGNNLNEVDLNKLLEINKNFLNTFREFRGKTTNPTLNFSDPVEYIFALLQASILTKHGIHLSGDFGGMTEHALQFSDMRSLLSSLFTHKQLQYDKNEKLVSGIMGGLRQVTPDFVRSNDLKNINLIISNVNSRIGQKMVDQSYIIHDFTMKLYKAMGYSMAERMTIGESQGKYKNFFLTDPKTGEVSTEFKTKNPYESDPKNALKDYEVTYLKNMLFQIQKYMLNLSSAEIAKINPESLESLKSNPKIAKAIESGAYFKIPLVRREELTRYADLTNKGLHGFWRKFKNKLHEVNDFIDPKSLEPEELKQIKETAVGFTEMYDVYGKQTDEYKARVFERHATTYFEWNLDTIAHRVAFNKIRKVQFDAKLPIIGAYVWWLKLQGGKENEELTKVMSYISDQLKLAAFDEPIIDDEFKDVATVTAIIKKITTAALLAFRPVLLFKELTIGVMKGVGLAATNFYGGENPFTVKDLAAAYKKMITIDHKFSDEFNLLERINHYYRFANMDINTIAKKLQTDRHGILRGMGRWMYSMNTIPDYYNRLSLFVAKMIHDGSYDAHSLVDGKMVYDVTKDKRFSHYLAERHKHKDANGKYIPAKNDIEYNKQRNLYNLMIERFNLENAGTDEPILTEDSLITKAYTEQERNSFKSFTDMAYGYYDKDSQAHLTNTWYGMIWLHFMQFWPGKMRQWFGKPVDAANSPIGSFKQKTMEVNGVETLLWRKYNEETSEFDTVTEDTGDPLLEWVGTPQEGIIYSFLFTLQDLFKMNWKDLNNEARLRRVLYGLHDALLMFIIMGLFTAFLQGLRADSGDEGLSAELLKFGESVSVKVTNEQNILQNTLFALDTEPIILSYGTKVSQDILDTLTGDKTIRDVLARDVGMMEFLKP